MTQPSFHTATLDEVTLALDWAASEGWNPGLDDAAAFYGSDQSGFFVARVADIMVATISVVNHDDTMAFLGLYLCQPEFRGQGIGFALWQHALEHAGSRCVGLDGVASQEANYAKSGFVRSGTTTRFQGTVPKPAADRVRPLNVPDDFEAITLLDAQAIGFARPRFLSAWVSDKCATRKTVVLEEQGQITGFATARLCRDGAKIGPIVAFGAEAAWSLTTAAAALVEATQVSVDLPDTSKEFQIKLESKGFEPTFETARMYRGESPKSSSSAQAIATMELG